MSMSQDAAKMAAKLRQIGKQIPQRTAAAMYEEAQADIVVMKERCPIRTGKLRDSGEVHEPEQHGNEIVVTSSFGGPDVPYAVEQHEHLEFAHDVGEAK